MIKERMSSILMIVGIVLMAVSGYVLFEWRFIQSDSPTLEKVVIEETGEIVEPKVSYSLSSDLKEKSEEDMLVTEDVYIYQTSRKELEDGMMYLQIPKLDVSAEIMNGTSKSQLKKGPGLYDMSPLVYEFNANVLIAGHRTTYGKWFRHVDKLTEGDPIVIQFENHDFLYEVEKVFIVQHNDWSVTEPQGYSALTLTACHPLYSAKQRIVVRAKLVETTENTAD